MRTDTPWTSAGRGIIEGQHHESAKRIRTYRDRALRKCRAYVSTRNRVAICAAMLSIASASHPEVTALLRRWGAGDEAALDRLIPLVERELHVIARRCLAGERPGHSLQATALVNEAYLRLVDVQHVNWKDRVHFMAVGARLDETALALNVSAETVMRDWRLAKVWLLREMRSEENKRK
jgi:hypothetical protein